MEKRGLTDRDFRAVEMARKTALASLIRRSGLSYSRIALESGVERRAVKRAVDREGIRFDTAVRIEYFLEWYLTNIQPYEERKNLFIAGRYGDQ